ncbi:MAG: ABC transporter permease [Verrucomicrobiaceae bacterium]|nr:ABC transporter permease [Verrucomicrobiaceae bacterium]
MSDRGVLRTGKSERSWFSSLMLGLVVLFLYLPLVVLVVNSFNASKYGGRWEGFTWSWYEKLWKDRATLTALGTTLKIAALATLGSTLLGTLAAWCLHRYRSRLQSLHLVVTELPLAVPDIWIGVALQLFFVQVGWELGFGTVLAAHVTFCLCYVTALMVGRLQSFDIALLDAARDLGAGPWQVAWRVVLPLLVPGMLAAGMMAFILSVDDFVITFFVSGPGNATLPARVYGLAKTSRSLPVINALSTLLIVVTLIVATVGHRMLKPKSA